MEYDLFCTIGNTIYFFNSELPKEELLDENGDICIAPCDVLDWMEAKIGDEIGDDRIKHWGRFDDIHLVKAQSPRKKVSVSMKVPDVSEEHLSKMRYIIVKNTKMGNKIKTIYQKLLAYLEAFDEQCGVDSKWIQSIMDEYEATAGLEEMTVKEEDGAK